jgi:hypothetical protein
MQTILCRQKSSEIHKHIGKYTKNIQNKSIQIHPLVAKSTHLLLASHQKTGSQTVLLGG